MASKKLYDMFVVTSKYTDVNGNEKSTWEQIGSLMESNKDGKVSRYVMLKATFNPAAIQREKNSSYIFVSLFPPKDKEQGQQRMNVTAPTGTQVGNINPDPYDPDFPPF